MELIGRPQRSPVLRRLGDLKAGVFDAGGGAISKY